MKAPSRIAVRAPNWIGDHIMARGFYAGLRRAYPDAYITLIGSAAVTSLPLGAEVDELRTLPADRNHFPVFLKVADAIREDGFDLGVTLAASASSALLFLLGGIPSRVGFAKGGGQTFLTSPLKWEGVASGKHKRELYGDLLEFLTGRRPPEMAAAHRGEAEKRVVVAPGASNPVREWPYFWELFHGLRERYPDHTITVVGGETEKKWKGRLRALASLNLEDRIGETSLGELVDLCASARVVVANDSGVAHVAATLAGVPTVVLYGPGDPRYISPLGNVSLLREELPCSPCESARCEAPFGFQECLRRLTPQRVLEECYEKSC